jgi:hypothetical protein
MSLKTPSKAGTVRGCCVEGRRREAHRDYDACGELFFSMCLTVNPVGDRALAAVSDGGQDRSPWSTGVFENQRGDAGRIYREPRVLRARHAGRRRHSRNVLPPGAAFSRFWEAADAAPPIAEPRPRRSKTPTLAVVKSSSAGAEDFGGGREPQNRLKIHLQSKASASSKIPARILEY